MSTNRNKPVDEMAREHAASAIDTLSEIMNSDWEESKDRIRAAEALLDRGYGKAAQAIIQVPASRKQEAILAALSDEQLVAIIESKQLPRLTPSQPLITIESAPLDVPLAHAKIKRHAHVSRNMSNAHGPAVDIYSNDKPPRLDPLLL